MTIGGVISLVFYSLFMFDYAQSYLSNYSFSSVLSFIVTVLVFLIFGVFLPRIPALIRPNLYLKITAVPLYIIYMVIYPLSKIIFSIGKGILRLFRAKLAIPEDESPGKEDLDSFIQKTIDDSPENTELDKEVRLFQNAMEFPNVKVKDCIVPRTEIVAVDKNTSKEDLINLFVKSGLSKIIVYEGDIDNITGYIHSSELFHQPDDWTQSIHDIPFFPENMAANKLMKNMLAEKKSIVMVVDEFGGTVGIVTLEDLVEEIFGDIEDEHDVHSLFSKQIKEDEFIFSGRMEIDHVNEEYNLTIPESDDYMTIAGYILNKHQDFPKVNDVITIDRFVFTILKITHAKIELVKMKLTEN